MSYQHKDNSGSLFKNDKKRDGKKDADYRGSAVIDGREYWIDSWINKSDKGTFMGLKFKPKDAPQHKPTATTRPDGGINPPNDPQGDDVPF